MENHEHWFSTVTAWFVLLAPVAILTVDWLVNYYVGYCGTITAVVRGWAAKTPWAEFLYVLGVTVLYLHLFRGWPSE